MMRVLEDCNIKFSSVVANTSGVKATALIDMLCEGRKLTMADIESVYHKKLSASPQELLEDCTGFVEDLASEIGLDMSAFPSEKHLASWAGHLPWQ